MITNENSKLIIDKTHVSPNSNERIRFLVLHYTALDFENSLKVLLDPNSQVSAHFLVPETSIDAQRKVFQLVNRKLRAWHAGNSAWQTRCNLNDTSIGIEIVNLGYKDENGKRTWYPFSDYQIDTIIKLAKIIIAKYQIEPTCVVGHSDIAPGRKTDPGPLFPWKKLYEHSVGAWFDDENLRINANNKIDIKNLQTYLQRYGYDIIISGELDQQTRIIIQAFQMHFRPRDYSGNPDPETYAILENLIQKYFPA
jgi:N-acetylmuramoyl-L-alanine amidase